MFWYTFHEDMWDFSSKGRNRWQGSGITNHPVNFNSKKAFKMKKKNRLGKQARKKQRR